MLSMLYLLSMLYGIGMCSAKHFVRREVAEVDVDCGHKNWGD